MKILCPNDFSLNAMSALETAIYYTKLLDADLHIITIAKSELDVSHKTTKLNQLLAGLSAISEGYISPSVTVLHGHPAEEIIQYSNRNHIDWIIMGTKGHNSLKNLFFGSVTNYVASISKIPILAVPQEQTVEFTTSMLLAVDDLEFSHESIFKIPLEIAKSNDVKIDILHIQNKKETLPFDIYLFALLKEMAGEVHLINGDNVAYDIKQFAEQNNTGLLIMIRRNKLLLDKLLQTANTKIEASITNIPLMILPDN